jgi:hypothetical protein
VVPSRGDDPRKKLRSNRSTEAKHVYILHGRMANKEIPV